MSEQPRDDLVLAPGEPRRGRLTVYPYRVGIVICNGRVEGVYHEGTTRLPRGDVRTYIASIAPFNLTFWLQDPGDPSEPGEGIALDQPVLTADGQLVTGRIDLTLSVVPDSAEHLLQLLGPQRHITRRHIADAIKGELLAKVLALDLHRHTAGDLRGNRDLFQGIYASLELELASTISRYGLKLDNFYVNWGLNPEEWERIKEERHRSLIRDIERQRELERLGAGRGSGGSADDRPSASSEPLGSSNGRIVRRLGILVLLLLAASFASVLAIDPAGWFDDSPDATPAVAANQPTPTPTPNPALSPATLNADNIQAGVAAVIPQIPQPTAVPTVSEVTDAFAGNPPRNQSVVTQPAIPPVAAKNDTYTVGVMESITGPGKTYGQAMLQAKQMAVDQINAAGGINGRNLEIIVEDSKCSAADAITAYVKLTDVDRVKVILGTSCSGAMLGAAPLAEADGVVLLSASATNPDIANAGDYIFRTAINDLKLGVDTGNVLWADGIRTLATITEATDYAEGVWSTSVAQFRKRGGKVVAAESYSSDTFDLRRQLTRMINARPDAIHIAAQAEASGGTIIKQIRELGYQGPLYTESVAVGTTALEIAGEAATGTKAIQPELDPANPAAQQMLSDYKERYGELILNWFLGSAYDDVNIAAECLKQTGDDQDANGFRDCLYDITYSGTIGVNYGFDDNGEVVGLSNAVVQVLPVADRTDDNLGYRVLGLAPME